jgi:hypothetical protein
MSQDSVHSIRCGPARVAQIDLMVLSMRANVVFETRLLHEGLHAVDRDGGLSLFDRAVDHGKLQPGDWNGLDLFFAEGR